MRGEPESVFEQLDEAVDHARGPAIAPVILEYGDYECPYSRQTHLEDDDLRGYATLLGVLAG